MSFLLRGNSVEGSFTEFRATGVFNISAKFSFGANNDIFLGRSDGSFDGYIGIISGKILIKIGSDLLTTNINVQLDVVSDFSFVRDASNNVTVSIYGETFTTTSTQELVLQGLGKHPNFQRIKGDIYRIQMSNGIDIRDYDANASGGTGTVLPDVNQPSGVNDIPLEAVYTWVEYVPDVDTIAPVITVSGNQVTTINNGDPSPAFTATASDNVDGDITNSIIESGDTIDPNTNGSYIRQWNVSDAAGNQATEVTREVIVSSDADTTIPVITVTGNASTTITEGDPSPTFTATASDNLDGNITSSIVVSGDTVDANTPATYIIRYNVTDAAGNSAVEVTRTVVVQSASVIQGTFNIVWEGDSRTVGVGSAPATPIPDRVAGLISPTPIFANYALQGQQTNVAASNYFTKAGTQFSSTAEFNVYIINGFGINDIRLERTSAQIITSLTLLADRAKATGYDVIITTIPPRDTTTAQGEIYRNEVNDWIMNGGLPSIDTRIDLNADTRIGIWNSTYYTDVAHLNFEGQDIWTDILVSSLQSTYQGVALESTVNMSISGIPSGTYDTRILEALTGRVLFFSPLYWDSESASQLVPLPDSTAVEYYVLDSTNCAVNRGITV
jgi:lysophospholipase L1-like esterase